MYTTNFNVNKYLEQFPNPFQHFSDNDRTNPIQDDDDKKYALNFLFNHYRFIRMKNIITIFNSFNKNLTETCTRLDRFPKNFRNPRQIKNCDSIKNKALLQEVYLKIPLLNYTPNYEHTNMIFRLLSLNTENIYDMLSN